MREERTLIVRRSYCFPVSRETAALISYPSWRCTHDRGIHGKDIFRGHISHDVMHLLEDEIPPPGANTSH